MSVTYLEIDYEPGCWWVFILKNAEKKEGKFEKKIVFYL